MINKKSLIIFQILSLQVMPAMGLLKSLDLDKEARDYINNLKRNGVASYIIMKQIYHADNSPASNITYTIYYKSKSQLKLQKISSGKKYSLITLASGQIDIFNQIQERKMFFKAKDDYYARREKKVRFIPPKAIHNSITLTVRDAGTESYFEMVDEEYDPSGDKISMQPWFRPIKQIVTYLDSID